MSNKHTSIGKKIGNNHYFHKSALEYMDTHTKELVNEAKKILPKKFNYEIIKINKTLKTVSFIESSDWNSTHEPLVGDSYKIDVDSKKIRFTKKREKNPQIYHHKWMFVSPDYKGFDYGESKKRSEQWESLKLNIDKKKIGNLEYWKEHVEKYLNPTEKIKWINELATPKDSSWERGITFDEAISLHPALFHGTLDKNSREYTPHPTQVSKTVLTYEKIYNYLSEIKFEGVILDASSGMGLGTDLGIKKGFKIEDVEMYSPLSHTPTYRTYKEITNTYDFIICSMVLNIITQDKRDDLVRCLANMLNPGGRILFTVRSKREIENQPSKQPFRIDPSTEEVRDLVGEYFFPSKKSYQKGFTNLELIGYLKDILQNDFINFQIEPLNYENSGLKNYAGALVSKMELRY